MSKETIENSNTERERCPACQLQSGAATSLPNIHTCNSTSQPIEDWEEDFDEWFDSKWGWSMPWNYEEKTPAAVANLIPSSEEVKKYCKTFISSLLTKAREEEREFLKDLDLDFKVICCDCGEEWKNTDPHIAVKERLNSLNNQ